MCARLRRRRDLSPTFTRTGEGALVCRCVRLGVVCNKRSFIVCGGFGAKLGQTSLPVGGRVEGRKAGSSLFLLPPLHPPSPSRLLVFGAANWCFEFSIAAVALAQKRRPRSWSAMHVSLLLLASGQRKRRKGRKGSDARLKSCWLQSEPVSCLGGRGGVEEEEEEERLFLFPARLTRKQKIKKLFLVCFTWTFHTQVVIRFTSARVGKIFGWWDKCLCVRMFWHCKVLWLSLR